MLKTSLDRRFRRDIGDTFIHLADDGYCMFFHWKRPIAEWEMKEQKGGYFLNVEKHRWMCAFCPDYMPASLARAIEIYMRDQKELYDIMKRLLSLYEPYEGDARVVERE